MAGIATQQALRLDLFVNEEDWKGQFDRLEVWRSRMTPAGPYEPLTAEMWQSARVPNDAGTALEPTTGSAVPLVGKELQLRVNERIDVTVTFGGVDPVTFASAAEQVAEQGYGLVHGYLAKGGQFVVESIEPGLRVVLRVVGGDAAALLNLPLSEPRSVSFGRDARVALKTGEERYSFTDPNGDRDYFYKTRFYNSATGAVSDFSPSFRGVAVTSLSADALVRGYVDLVGLDGISLANRQVLLHARFQGTRVEDKHITGGPQSRHTDVDGHVEFMLPRGARVTVAIAGTDLVRDVLVPTSPNVESFNLLDPAVGTNDLFAVQRPVMEFAARRAQ